MATTTQQLPLFYKKVVPLNKEQHKDLHLKPVAGFSFTATTNSIYIAAGEFPRASRDYPIVFGRDPEGMVFPVVLLGLKKNQNLYVDKNGKWNAEYIPAYARRYPFMLASTGGEGEQLAVCIDEGFSGFNSDKDGQPLFDENGEQTPILTNALEFLRDYQKQVQLTTAFCKNLVELDILEPMQANIETKSGGKYAIGGFQCVSREKLNGIDGDKMLSLAKTGQLELIYAHLLSLNNVNRLIGRLNQDVFA